MAGKNVLMFIKNEYLKQIKSGKKTKEARLDYNNLKHIVVGTIIKFQSGSNSVTKKVIAVNRYKTFERMLQVEKVENLLPGMDLDSGLEAYYSIYPEEKLNKVGGAVVFVLK